MDSMNWPMTLAMTLLRDTHYEAVANGEHDGRETIEFIKFTGASKLDEQLLQWEFNAVDTHNQEVHPYWLCVSLVYGNLWLSNGSDRISPIRVLRDRPIK